MKFINSVFSATVFSPTVCSDAGLIYRKLSEGWHALFDGPPLIMPIPSDAPKEIPFMVLRSKDQTCTATFSNASVTFQMSGPMLTIEKFHSSAMEFIAMLIDMKITSIVTRVAAGAHRYHECPNPGKVLSEHFCTKEVLSGPLNRPENFELHAHKHYSMVGIETNSWFRCKTVTLIQNDAPAIMVEQDLNTVLQNPSQALSSKEIMKFFKNVYKEADNILNLYFGKGVQIDE